MYILDFFSSASMSFHWNSTGQAEKSKSYFDSIFCERENDLTVK